VRRVGLANTEHATATVQTIRLKLFKVGAWVQKSVRRWVVEVGASLGGADIERISVGRSVRDRGRPVVGSPVGRHFVADREIERRRPPFHGWGKGGSSADDSHQPERGPRNQPTIPRPTQCASQQSRDRPNAIES
jgi:hypothetical protein